MIQRQKFRTKKARKRERVRIAVRVSMIFLGIILVLVGIAYGSNAEQMRFKNIYVQTDGILSQTELANVIKTELDGKYFGVWPKDSVISIPKEQVETILQTSFPRIRTASVKRTGLFTLSASVLERLPVALWCGDVVPPTMQEQSEVNELHSENLWGTCYLLDTSGYIYAPAPLFSGNLFPRYYGSLEQAEPVAQQYIPEEEFVLWQNFYTTLESVTDAVPQALLFVDESDIELYLSNGLRILVPRKEEPGTIKHRLEALFASDNIKDIEAVEYVDLRFGNKAFVKYVITEKQE